MNPSDPSAESDVCAPWRVPFLEHLRAQPITLEPGRARLELVIEQQHLRNLGIMHGGVLAAVLDTVMGMAASTRAAQGQFVVTVQLNVNFVRPAWLGETLVGTGIVQHAGKQTAVARGEVHTAEGALVGTGSGTFMFLEHVDPAQDRFPRQPEPPARPPRGQGQHG